MRSRSRGAWLTPACSCRNLAALGFGAEAWYVGRTEMKLRDCHGIANSSVIRISAEELQPLWISDYYDGPLSGAVVHNGQFRWYVMGEEEQEPYTDG